MVQGESIWSLPNGLQSGASLDLELSVAPATPDGTYEIWWDMLIDERAYFRQFAGLEPVVSEGVVRSSGVAADAAPVASIVEPRVFLGREDVFAIALERWGERPIIGVGPGQLTTDRPENERVPHAHNIVLEPLATWGLLGTVPLLIVLGGGLAQALARCWRRPTDVATVVAVSLAIILVHGATEWPLGHVSIGIPLGLLLGGAWSLGSTQTDELETA